MTEAFDGLDVIIVDDDPQVCELITSTVKQFYNWGKIYPFADFGEAVGFCLEHRYGIGVFIVDVFLGNRSGFDFLAAVSEKFKSVYEDTIIVTGSASEKIVRMCLDADVNYLLEKPVRRYALQLAVKAIATKYFRFALKMQEDPEFVQWVNAISKRYFAQLPRLPKRAQENLS